VTEEEARRRGHAFIAGLPDSGKKLRMLAVLDAYMDGKKTCQVAAAAGVSKGSVSGYPIVFDNVLQRRMRTARSVIPCSLPGEALRGRGLHGNVFQAVGRDGVASKGGSGIGSEGFVSWRLVSPWIVWGTYCFLLADCDGYGGITNGYTVNNFLTRSRSDPVNL
jgi:hypothetical protein